jgi:putative transposase
VSGLFSRGDGKGVRTLFQRADRGKALGMAKLRRAGLVQRAEDWQSGSVNRRMHKPKRDPLRLTPWPMARLLCWAAGVNQPLTAAERHAVRTSVNRDTPPGDETWVQRIAQQLNLQLTLRPRGRPTNES